jgi:hypothetical protein
VEIRSHRRPPHSTPHALPTIKCARAPLFPSSSSSFLFSPLRDPSLLFLENRKHRCRRLESNAKYVTWEGHFALPSLLAYTSHDYTQLWTAETAETAADRQPWIYRAFFRKRRFITPVARSPNCNRLFLFLRAKSGIAKSLSRPLRSNDFDDCPFNGRPALTIGHSINDKRPAADKRRRAAAFDQY